MTDLFPFEFGSFTYGGMPTDQINNTRSNLTIIAFTCSFIYGPTVLTKIGQMISTMHPFLLCIPSSIIIVLVGAVFVGVTYVHIYSPLIIRNDKE